MDQIQVGTQAIGSEDNVHENKTRKRKTPYNKSHRLLDNRQTKKKKLADEDIPMTKKAVILLKRFGNFLNFVREYRPTYVEYAQELKEFVVEFKHLIASMK